MSKPVVILGGGASGTLLAMALIRRLPECNIRVIEKAEKLGPGVAYSTAFQSHLLNVPASKMAAYPAEPEHFVDWLKARYPDRFGPQSFVPRSIYGEYLRGIANDAKNRAGERLSHYRLNAKKILQTPSGIQVRCSNGDEIDGAVVVLASGNPPPAPLPGLPAEIPGDESQAPHVFASAWDTGALTPVTRTETIVLLGAGLTAIDAVLALRENGHGGKIYMISRRGMLPHEHRAAKVLEEPVLRKFEGELLFEVARSVRDENSSKASWRERVDSLRPLANELWRNAPVSQQRAFLRHMMPYWNVHRHRMAPETAREIASLSACATVEVLAGRACDIAVDRTKLNVLVRQSSPDRTLTIEADRIINCTGPLVDYRRAGSNEIFASLLREGAVIAPKHGSGIEVGPDGAVIGSDGSPSQKIFTIGPTRYGSFIETTAIPEIRQQAVELASHLAAVIG